MTAADAAPATASEVSVTRLAVAFLGFLASTVALSAVMVLLAQA